MAVAAAVGSAVLGLAAMVPGTRGTPDVPWAPGCLTVDHGCDACRRVAVDAYNAKERRDELLSRLAEISPELPKRDRAWEGPKPLPPDQYAVRGIRRNGIIAAVLFGVAVAVGLNLVLLIAALVWLGFGVLQYFQDAGNDTRMIVEYQVTRKHYDALVEARKADIADYQERRRKELPTIEAELAVAERELLALQQQMTEQRRRQRTGASA